MAELAQIRRGQVGVRDPGKSGATPEPATPMDPEQRRRIRRSVTVLAVIALALYFGFILYSVLLHGHR